MQPTALYRITVATEEDFSFYKKCFSNTSFAEGYGANVHTDEINDYLSLVLLEPYQDIKRYVLWLRKEAIAFCHLDFREDTIIVSGGLAPEYLNSGKGVYCAAIFYSFIFYSFSSNTIQAKILNSNLSSIRIHKALGFEMVEDGHYKIMALNRNQYPNPFLSKILLRVNYEWE